MRIVVVVQARMASTRLPGKVMLPLAGAPLLARMLERLQLARQADALVVATTVASGDEPIAKLCEERNISYVRGDPHDCLARHVQAARHMHADVVVKVPSDCPLIDPQVVDTVLSEYRDHADAVDYVSNLHPGSWPDGNDVEAIPRSILERIEQEASDPFDREHTTPFLWRHPERFRLHNVQWSTGWDLSKSQRWVVDWWEDYKLVATFYDALYPLHGPRFHVNDILNFQKSRPELAKLNAKHLHYDYRLTRPQP